jgi:predicted PurR-regulated permease PerM
MIDQPATDQRAVPEWLVHLAELSWRVLVVAALVAALAYVATVLATVTATILLSVIFAATFSPLVLRLRNRGWSRSKAAGAVTVSVLAIVLVTLLVIALAFVPYVPQVIDAIQSALTALSTSITDLQLPPELADAVDAIGRFMVGWLTAQAAALLAPVAQIFTVALLSLFTVFFLLQDGDKAWIWALQAGADWQRERITSSGHDALERVGGFLRGLAVLSAVNAIRDFVLLTLLGVPLAGPLSVLVFILGFIPYFGSLIATTLMVIVAWATVGLHAAVIFLVVITALNIVEGNVMMPLIYGRTVNIHPAVALVAILAGGSIGGIMGVFVAIPLVAFAIAVGGSLIAVIDTQPAARRLAFVPGWLDRLAQWSWRILVAIGFVALLAGLAQLAPSVVVPVTFSLILAATFLPLVERLVARGWKRGVASIVATLGGIGLIVALGVLSIVAMIPQLTEIATDSMGGAGSIASNTDTALEWLQQVVQTFGLGIIATAVTGLAFIGVVAIILIISAVLCFYFLSEGHRFWAALVGRLPTDRRAEVDTAGGKAVSVLGGYMIATGVISAFAAATQWLIMAILGIPLALPLAVLAFFGGFIPYIGSLLTTLAALLVTIAVGTPQQIAIMAIWTLVFNVVQGNVVAPLVYGRAVNIHPAVVLLALPAGNAIAGVMGMFLAVPFIGVVAATWRIVLRVFGPMPPGPGPSVGEEGRLQDGASGAVAATPGGTGA